jgi:hypothetical protein
MVSNFEYLNLDIVSNFGIRISDLEFVESSLL